MDPPVKPEDDLGGMGAIFLDAGSESGMTRKIPDSRIKSGTGLSGMTKEV